jgi:hypothetical protein
LQLVPEDQMTLPSSREYNTRAHVSVTDAFATGFPAVLDAQYTAPDPTPSSL